MAKARNLKFGVRMDHIE